MSPCFEIKSADAKKISRIVRKSKEVASITVIQQSLIKHFRDIQDPRVERTKKHQFTDINRDRYFSNNWRSALNGKTLRITALLL